MKKLIILLILICSASAYTQDPMGHYAPTNIQTFEQLKAAFDTISKRSYKGSECYDRAHYWSYQMSQNLNINSTKVFVFFTKKYKREINGQWWFHVAPGVVYNHENYMIDPEFINKPVNFETWKNGVLDHAILKLTPYKINYEKEITSLSKELFILKPISKRSRKRIKYINTRVTWLNSELDRMLINKNRIIKVTDENWPYKKRNISKMVDLNCKEITNYSEYENNQESEYCYIIRSNMYYWAPKSLELLESEDKYKDEFDKNEVYTAKKRAFKGRFF